MIKAIGKKLIDSVRQSAAASRLYVALFGLSLFPEKWKGQMKPALDQFCPGFDGMGYRERRRLYNDIVYCMLVHGISPSEYFIYDFGHLSESGRSEYLGDLIKDMLCTQMEDKRIRRIFNDKSLTYRHFRPYFRRDCVCVEKDGDWDAFSSFHDAHDVYMIKPVFESRGKNIRKVDKSREPLSKRELFEQTVRMGTCMLEEYIDQGDPLRAVHPDSVNTVRFATCIHDGVVRFLFAELRMGCGDSFVDNAGAGGIVAPIDLETGIITGKGCRENGEKYICHPDSKVQIVGMRIPDWDSLLKLAEQLAKVVPEQKYVGWDLGYSKDGWVLVEGNHRAQMVGYQLCSGRGIRREILEALDMDYRMF